MADMPETVSALIREGVHRLGKGGQSQLADAVGVRTASVSRWVRGESTPTSDKWNEIEAALALRPGSLMEAHISTLNAAPTPAPHRGDVDERMRALEADLSDLRRLVVNLAARIEERGLATFDKPLLQDEP